MYIETRCPVHNKPLYGNGQTSTHNLFKCPECDYSGGNGAVRGDLPERYNELEAENHKLKLTMRLHAGDCCSLNNEVELFRGHWEDAEDRCNELEAKNKGLRKALQWWIDINKGAPNKYEWAEQALKGRK